MLRSNLCDYSDAYVVVKEAKDILAAAANENDKTEKEIAFKNNAPFRSCLSKIKSTLISKAEDLDIIMLSLWNYYRDKIGDVDDDASDGKSFEYKTKKVGNTPERPENEGDANRPPVQTLNVEVTIPLKYLSNF